MPPHCRETVDPGIRLSAWTVNKCLQWETWETWESGFAQKNRYPTDTRL
ncbi:2387_t:CDS:2 [Paraglomus occultum]|uniref:2387_t:CDS:1 n=1 Tax=Paraglomus occultum TaxID=144539 RepID=A0A9N8Z124_9GLOM|nr:2387_t:CDS:2 [Paraglomus occultum]